jgi:hypothetical protein
MGHAVAGRKRKRASVKPIIAILFLAVLVSFLSCAAPKPLETRKDESKVVALAPIAEAEKDRKPPRPLPVIQPVQLSFESDPVLYAALSEDGKTVAYVLENEEDHPCGSAPRTPPWVHRPGNGWRTWAEFRRRHCPGMAKPLSSWQRIMTPKGTFMCFHWMTKHPPPGDSPEGTRRMVHRHYRRTAKGFIISGCCLAKRIRNWQQWI